MSDPTNKNDSRKQLVAVAIAASMISPLAMAAPATAEVEMARSQIALLRGLAKAEAPVASEHPVLQRAVAEAQQPQASVAEGLIAHSNGHISDHWNSHSNVKEAEGSV